MYVLGQLWETKWVRERAHVSVCAWMRGHRWLVVCVHAVKYSPTHTYTLILKRLPASVLFLSDWQSVSDQLQKLFMSYQQEVDQTLLPSLHSRGLLVEHRHMF